MGKHRTKHVGKRVKKAALAGTVAATAAALTMGLTAPSAGAAAAFSSQTREVDLAALEGLNLGAVLESLGINIPNIGDLLQIPGAEGLPVNIITTGPPFGALGILGLNPTWVPAFPDQIAEQINNTPYADVSLPTGFPNPTILAIAEALQAANPSLTDTAALLLAGQVCLQRSACTTPTTFPAGIPNLRVPIVIAFGLGSLSTGMAWDQVVADLPNQPGGTNSEDPERSLTIVPMFLLRNPGRANGGIAARFAPIFGLFGINTVTPDFDVEQSGDATLVPIKIDSTVQWDPISDFPSWPNPFALANSAAAFAFPTYILRGSEASPTEMAAETFGAALPGVLGNILVGATEDIPDNVSIPATTVVTGTRQVCRFSVCVTVPITQTVGPFNNLDPQQVVRDIADIEGDYFAVNEYLTFRQNALPLLEPFRYPADIANLFTGGAFGFTNPFADAIEPTLTSLVSLGYTDVVRNPDGTYTRTLDEAGLNANSGGVPFGTLPEGIDWGQVPGDLFQTTIAGFEDAFFSGGIPGVHPGVPVANPLAIIAGLLGLDGGIPALPNLLNAFPDLADIIGGNLGLPDLKSTTTLAAAAAPPVGGGSDDPLTRLGETLARTLNIAFEREAPVPYTPPTSPVDSAFDVSEGLSASALRLLAATVLGPTRLAALADGGPQALADLIESTVDAPLWIADPALYGLRDALPADAADSVTDFRDGLWALTERINEALLGALDDLPNAPADVTITSDQAKGGVDDPQIEATLRSAGSGPISQPAGDTQLGQPVDEADGAPVIVPEDGEKAGGKGDQKISNGTQIKGGHLSKAIEDSINDAGKRLNDAVVGTQKTLTKVFTPKKSTVNTDDAPKTADKPDADTPAA